MKLHELKCDPGPFVDVWSTRKTFEIRHNDRDYHCNDVLRLREWLPYEQRYTGRELVCLVTHMLDEPVAHAYGAQEGFVVLSIKMLARLPGAVEKPDSTEPKITEKGDSTT